MSSNAKVPLSAASVQLVGNVLAQHPGITAEDMAKHGGWSVKHASMVLTAAGKAGIAAYLRDRGCTYWWPVAGIAAARAHSQDQRRQRERNRSITRRMRSAGIKADAAGDLELSDAPMRTWAHASAPLPFRCTAPRSVFELGGV